jgi:hypothetical protein
MDSGRGRAGCAAQLTNGNIPFIAQFQYALGYYLNVFHDLTSIYGIPYLLSVMRHEITFGIP